MRTVWESELVDTCTLVPYYHIHGEGIGLKVAWNALECGQKEGLIE